MSAASPEPLVRFIDVSKSYDGKVDAVRALNLEVEAGEFLTLLGPSGSGKTTTLTMLAGFEQPTRGRIFVGGEDVTGVPVEKRGIGMVFQNYALFPHLTVAENIGFPLKQRGVAKAERAKLVGEALELVHLPGYGERYPRQLSGGQQQRVALARAIVFKPRLLLMDEPLGALDKNLRYDMQVEIKEIQRRLGMTVVYVTHDQEEAMNMSDRIAIMNRGRIEQVGMPSEVYERPSNAFVGRFLGEANILDGTIDGLEGDCATLRVGGLVLRARVRDAVTVGSRASLFVRPEKVTIRLPGAGERSGNRVEGRVRRVSFLGNIVRYLVEAAPSTHVMVDVQNDGRPPLAVDTAVALGWAMDDSLILAG